MEVYTTGFTKKTAAQFFEPLKQVDIKRLIDVRLNNSSQLAGFTKKEDIRFFLKEICGIEYLHEPLLAPTQDMLDFIFIPQLRLIMYERLSVSLLHTQYLYLMYMHCTTPT